MRRLGSVQQKIPCVFLTDVKEEASRKHEHQQFQVVATENVNPVALEANVDCAFATEKLDGTCCYVAVYQDFSWNVEEDFKMVPESWIPAHRVKHSNGHPIPDEHGHIPGWVPVQKSNKQYCWHSSVVDYELGVALVLKPGCDDDDLLEITALPLADLQEQTLELIGTNVNGNPYGLGSKKQPIHCLVPHGSIPVRNPPPVNFQLLSSWFQENCEGRVEGIVWHCNDGTLIKIHRHHLGLRWPDGETRLGSRPAVVRLGGASAAYSDSEGLLSWFSPLNGQRFSRLQDVHF
ncbi:RNA ligase 1 isoform X3 [Poecilia latipinna]|uniref:RNA ligase 1 isoform X3 n=1 Tax=Poecilia latipinna TaxID=48699 RepID=UPI00072E42C5|nr:PREDICTED: uncharacterized protein C12orf29 homolog isoform X3 [Poecilia latipinna]XP_016536329.1 PREDICTED: uncharacterized protein C12orf29 homolog isoform X3 [Poecilia formosa]